MTAMFPGSGVPATDARNSIPDPNTVNCNELWYSTSRCQPRFDPAAANAQLAELINLINQAEMAYDCNYLDQVQKAVRYIDQRGLARGTNTIAGPAQYIASLSPAATRYNNYMTLTIVPNIRNNGPVQLNLDGLGFVSVLRNDGMFLEAGDWQPDRPTVIAYWNGAWYHIGLVRSQVPIFLTSDLVLWVRTDGNDLTGDGSANDATHAFRTIQRAFDVAASRFAMSAKYSVMIRLGIPGTYEAAYMNGALTLVTLYGDPANSANYRISSKLWTSSWAPLVVSQMSMAVVGVTLLCDASSPSGSGINVIGGSIVMLNNMRFELTINNTLASFISLSGNSGIFLNGFVNFIGNGLNIGSGISMTKNATMWRADPTFPVTSNWSNINFSGNAQNIQDVSNLDWEATTITVVACVGPKHFVNNNAILSMRGNPEPGSTAGSVATGGVFNA